MTLCGCNFGQSGFNGGGSQRRTGSTDPSNVASKNDDASTACICSVAVPAFRKPCFRWAGTIRDWPPVKTICCSSIHISASPEATVSTSSTGCQWVGAAAAGASHCSNMQSCVAPLQAETCIRVSTPARHSSRDRSPWATILIDVRPSETCPTYAHACGPFQGLVLPWGTT